MRTLKKLVSLVLVFSMIASMLMTVTATTVTAESDARTGVMLDEGEYYVADKMLEEIPATYQMWIKIPSEVYSTATGIVLGNKNSDDQSDYFAIGLKGNGKLYFECANNGKVRNWNFGSFAKCVIPADTWTHVTVIQDVSATKVYCVLNGTWDTGAGSGTTNFVQLREEALANPIRIGDINGVEISDVNIYSEVRGSSLFPKDYANGPDLTNENLMAYYKISSSKQGSPISDVTGNGYDLKYVNLNAPEEPEISVYENCTDAEGNVLNPYFVNGLIWVKENGGIKMPAANLSSFLLFDNALANNRVEATISNMTLSWSEDDRNGIVFAFTDIDGDHTWSNNSGSDLSYYWACVEGKNNLQLWEMGAQQSWKCYASVSLSSLDIDVTESGIVLMAEWDENGNIRVFANGILAIEYKDETPLTGNLYGLLVRRWANRSGSTNPETYTDICTSFIAGKGVVSPIVNVDAAVDSAEAGTVTGVGEYDYATRVTLTATPNEGYTFVGWYENGKFVSSGSTFTFTAVSNRNFTAKFAVEPAKIIYGDVTGDGEVNIKDVIILRKYIEKFDYSTGTSSVDIEAGADANGDGTIDMNDVNLIREYIAKYNYSTGTSTVVLGPSWETDGELKILAIGNSFSVDAMQYVYQIAQEAGVKKITLGNMYIGGCSLATHLSNARNNSAAYEYHTNTNGTWVKTEGVSIETAVTSENWDFITFQQASGYSGLANTYDDLNDLMAIVRSLNQSATFAWHMTWAYAADSTHSHFANYNNDQMTMYNAIVNAVETKILTNDKIDIIIPSGTAVQNVRTSFVGDITRDGYHLSYSFGRYVAGLTFLQALTGLSPKDYTSRPSDVDSHDIKVVAESVENAFKTPFAVTNSEYLVEPGDDSANVGVIPEGYVQLTASQMGLTAASYYNSGSTDVWENTSSAFARGFMATKKFTREELPVGSIIEIAEGWRYRPEGWEYTGTRPDNVSKVRIIIDEEWWGTYTERAFNISQVSHTTSNAAEITLSVDEVANTIFKIIVPESAVTPAQ